MRAVSLLLYSSIIISNLVAVEQTVKILCLGDSLTEGFGVLKEQSYPALLEKALRDHGLSVKVINSGQSGSTSKNGLKRIKWLARMKPDYVILALGANDGLRGLSLVDLEQNLRDVIEFAKQQEIQVILAGMKIPPNYGPAYTAEFEKVFERLAESFQLPLIDFLLDGVAGVAELNLPDGIHPTAEGYEIVTQNILKVVMPLVIGDTIDE